MLRCLSRGHFRAFEVALRSRSSGAPSIAIDPLSASARVRPFRSRCSARRTLTEIEREKQERHAEQETADARDEQSEARVFGSRGAASQPQRGSADAK